VLPGAASSRVIRLLEADAPGQLTTHERLVSGAWPAPPRLSAWQGSWLMLAEMLPEIVVAIAAGPGAPGRWSLVGPDLSLAAFTGSGAWVPVGAEPAAMALAAAGLLFVAVATLAGQAIVTSRRGVARAARMGE
jgi:hypothetical protein